MPTITPSLWFDHNLEEAAAFYTAIFPNSSIEGFHSYTEVGPGTAGDVAWGTFVLDGQRFIGINGGPQFPFSEAVSFEIRCKDQAEVDYYWERLLDRGVGAPPACGAESQCGWLKDRFGLSWQVTPNRLYELLEDPDRADAVNRVLHTQRRIVIAELEDSVGVK
jgi:predicted 3-demethylubiquinone-9 3-methyltransferase (glyoxalase superfamily)